MPTSNPVLPGSTADVQSGAPPSGAPQAQGQGRSVPMPAVVPRRTFKQVLLSYFYWTYARGSFHYDVMVTLILLFIFVTPRIPGWTYGENATTAAALVHPIQVVSDGGHGMILTVEASDANVPAGASVASVKKALRKAIEPVTGDAVFVEKWETVTDSSGNPAWKVWAHR